MKIPSGVREAIRNGAFMVIDECPAYQHIYVDNRRRGFLKYLRVCRECQTIFKTPVKRPSRCPECQSQHATRLGLRSTTTRE